MAKLISCKVCGGAISSATIKCLHCGQYRVPEGIKVAVALIAITTIILLILWFAYSWMTFVHDESQASGPGRGESGPVLVAADRESRRLKDA